MSGFLLNAVIFIGILVISALITQKFAAWMYITCGHCGTLNARRRTACRRCGHSLRG